MPDLILLGRQLSLPIMPSPFLIGAAHPCGPYPFFTEIVGADGSFVLDCPLGLAILTNGLAKG
jgi:hypothetical protein